MSRGAKLICLVWLCCIARVLFYSAFLPIWEGYDEWGHFAVIRLVALRGEILPPRDSPLPRDVTASLDLIPLPWSWRSAGPPHLTHDDFWQLPPQQRSERTAAFEQLPHAWQAQLGDGSYRAHEAYQPPLYYWMMAPIMLLFSGCGTATQLLAVRCCGAILGSLAVPLTFLIAREVFGCRQMALGCAAVLAAMPGFALVIAHSGNDCLAIALFSLLIWCAVRLAQGHTGRADTIALAASLGLGLLTKAYFLTAVPVIVLLAAWKLRRRAVAPLAGALAIGGWWYVRAFVQTGTWTGLTDFVMADSRREGLLPLAFRVPWFRAADSILFSHLYAGGWSFLQVRSWMYHVFYVVVLIALIGLLRWRRTVELAAIAAVYAAFWLGELYHVVILWAARGVATSMGYYLYGVIAAEVPLCTAGLAALVKERRRGWIAAAGATLFAALDLFATHAIAIPYYTGVIRHRANGALMALHLDALRTVTPGEVLRRVAGFSGLPSVLVLLLWIAYLAATLALVWICVVTALDRKAPVARPE